MNIENNPPRVSTLDPELVSLLKKAKEKYDGKDYLSAFTLVEEVVQSGFKSAEAFFLMGNLYHIKGELGNSIKAFQQCLEIEPGHTDAAISLSILYNDVGQYDRGKKVFQQANKTILERSKVKDPHIDRQFSNKHLELGDLYLRYHRYDEALFEYNKVTGLDPHNFNVRIKVAKVLAKKGFTSRAFQELKKLKTEQPDFLPARVNLGLLYYSQGNVVDAHAEWERVLFKDPQNKETLMYMKMARRATETRI